MFPRPNSRHLPALVFAGILCFALLSLAFGADTKEKPTSWHEKLQRKYNKPATETPETDTETPETDGVPSADASSPEYIERTERFRQKRDQQRQRDDLKAKLDQKKAELAEQAEEREDEAPPLPDATPPPVADVLAEQSLETNNPKLVMCLKPYRQTVRAGNRFMTEVALRGEKEQPFDAFRVCIAYPRLAMRPLRVFDHLVSDVLLPEKPGKTESTPGLLMYEAELSRPLNCQGSRPVLKIVWEALADNPLAELDLAQKSLPPEKQSAVFSRGTNLLQAGAIEGAACINASVIVGDPAGTEGPDLRIWRKGEPGLAESESARIVRGEGLTLRLEPPETLPAMGQEFVLNVWVDNPHFLAFDEVRLAVAFDPAKAQVLDWDYKNWIQRGVNVFDGHAHDTFPFNVHTRNEVRNGRGRIDYQVSSTRLASRPSGCLIRIHGLARAAGAWESFDLFSSQQSPQWFTDIRAEGASVLERPDASATEAALLTAAAERQQLSAR
jgi:hypothetical protein